VFAIGGVLAAVFLSFGILGKTTEGYAFRYPTEKVERGYFEKLGAERSRLIRDGICHFGKQAKTKLRVDEFLAQWNCPANSEGFVRLPLIVTGDSLSADIVMALKLNGTSPLQSAGVVAR
jgi:hypothetical protein